MLCKSESKDPGHCLKEGRRVTRCAADLYVECSHIDYHCNTAFRLTKMKTNCLEQFKAHWDCLENNNHVSLSASYIYCN